ncbi:MAG: ATP-binding protein [Spirochaetota bacterium]|nr:ATP-binding protein [Spirochaetota bacterium]OPZ39396.1 MAG: hypothetical protein BWY96_00227 [Spirochaetes bacterium ADurb.BinA120]HPI13406.1 ATP-binding protein [Spirochaetota bacterium]HPV99359.1 ATP-binding protein [Spirochaetota bacterium]
MWIERDIERYLREVSGERPACILTGGRQTGKTSLLLRLFPDIQYVSLDIPSLAGEAEESGESFLKRLSPPLIIDEVQYAPGIFRYLKADIDANRKHRRRFLLTGSQKFSLMQGVTESLAGRVSVVELYTLSAGELERWSQTRADPSVLLRWMFAGGYPELHAGSLDPQRYYGDLVATYLERDVRQALQVKNLRDYDRFLRLAAVRTGQLLSMNSFASDLGISPNTVKSWLSVLEASGIVWLLEPYYGNLSKRIVKSPKLYFTDTGLAAYLAGFQSEEDLAQSPLLGAFFETHVLGQMVRKYANRCRRPAIYYFRDHHGHEVDFIVPVGGRLKLYECKWSEDPSADVPSFAVIEKAVGAKNIISRSIITPGRNPRRKGAVLIEDSVEIPSLKV